MENIFNYIWTIFDWMPEQASTWAKDVDWVNNLINFLSLICTVAIVGLAVWFAFRYRQSRVGDRALTHVDHSTSIEVIWTIIPTLVCFYLFYYGYAVYGEMRNPPANALEINVEGWKWAWRFEHSSGKTESKTLVVPVNKPVRLIMTSRDVHHSFFIPAMRVKEDIIKGRYHYVWFEANRTGEFPIFCTEYCGTEHSSMLGTLKVVPEAEYLSYIHGVSDDELPLEEVGAKVFDGNCKTCHSIDGSKVIGPTFKKLAGSERKYIDDQGKSGAAVADENYLLESILYPQKKIAVGFENASPMIAYKGLLSEREINGVIAYLKAINKSGSDKE